MSQTKYVLVRIDDVGSFDQQKDKLIYELCKAGIQVTCAVVPTWLTLECIEFLKQIADKYPGSIEIHQHGYSHTNYSNDIEECEFGPLRSLKQQKQDIINGCEILRRAFSTLFFPVFTPPYCAYDYNTLIALKQVGFYAISTFAESEPNFLLPDIAPDIDCFLWHPTRERSWDDITLDWHNGNKKTLRGLILHPRLMTPKSVTYFSKNIPLLLNSNLTVNFSQLLSIGGNYAC